MFIEKEKALMQALITDPEYDFQEDDWEFWELTFLAFLIYVNTVVRMQVLLPIYQYRYDGQEYRDRVMNLDQTRRNAHESLIASLNIINRNCKKYGVEPFSGDDLTREEVGELAGNYVGEIFYGSADMSLYDVTKDRREEYSEEPVRSSLH